VQSLAGPIVGAVVFTWLQDTIIRATDYWRAVFGVVILVLVLVFPQGLAGGLAALAARVRWKPR
jgi:branched-chain amino acid transport system permease protein